jgi:hypothetical protein
METVSTLAFIFFTSNISQIVPVRLMLLGMYQCLLVLRDGWKAWDAHDLPKVPLDVQLCGAAYCHGARLSQSADRPARRH